MYVKLFNIIFVYSIIIFKCQRVNGYRHLSWGFTDLCAIDSQISETSGYDSVGEFVNLL